MAGDVLKQQFAPILAVIKSIIDPIKLVFSNLLGFIKTTWGGIGLIITGALTFLGNFISQLQNGFNVVKAIFTAIGVALTAVGAIILGAPAWIAGIIAGVIYVIAEGIVVVKNHWEEVSAWFNEKLTAFREWLNSGWQNIFNDLKSFLTPLSLYTTDTVQGLITKLEELWTSFKDWLAET